MSTRVISLSTDGNGYPVLPGSTRVSKVNDQFYMGLKSPVKAYGCWIEEPFAVAYLDLSGTWLVAASSETDLNTIGSGDSLDDFVDSTPQDWYTYKVNPEPEDTPIVVPNFDDLNKGILIALGIANPHSYKGLFNAIGVQATVRSGCGSLMRPSEIQQTTQWYGDELLTMMAVPIFGDRLKIQ